MCDVPETQKTIVANNSQSSISALPVLFGGPSITIKNPDEMTVKAIKDLLKTVDNNYSTVGMFAPRPDANSAKICAAPKEFPSINDEAMFSAFANIYPESLKPLEISKARGQTTPIFHLDEAGFYQQRPSLEEQSLYLIVKPWYPDAVEICHKFNTWYQSNPSNVETDNYLSYNGINLFSIVERFKENMLSKAYLSSERDELVRVVDELSKLSTHCVFYHYGVMMSANALKDPFAPALSVSGKTGNVTLNFSDVHKKSFDLFYDVNNVNHLTLFIKDGKYYYIKDIFDCQSLDIPRLPGEDLDSHSKRFHGVLEDIFSQINGLTKIDDFSQRLRARDFCAVRLPGEEATVFLARRSKLLSELLLGKELPNKRKKYKTDPNLFGYCTKAEEKQIGKMAGFGIDQGFNPFGEKTIWNKPI